MADGTHKAIKDIRVGDKVIATNPETEETGPRTVEATIIGHGLKKLVDLTIDTDGPAGGQTAFVVATAGHPFWVDGQQRWVRAADLHAGEDLLTQEGEPVRILTVRTYDQFNTVHNLSIESIHSYYVIAGDTAVLVHNTGPCWSIGSRMRAAGPGDEFGLPDQGRIRYVPPRGYNPVDPLPRGAQGGYLDRFGNEWVAGPSRTSGQPFEWEVQLSRRGKSQLGWLSRDRNHVNVSPLGEVTHR